MDHLSSAAFPRLADAHLHFGCADRLGELESYFRSNQVELAGVLSLPDVQRINFNPEVLYAKAKLGHRCRAFGSLDYADLFAPTGADIPPVALDEQVERLARCGFDGLKLWEGKPTFQSRIGLALDDPRFSSVFVSAARHRLPVVLHVADPPVFWEAAQGPADSSRLGWDEPQTSIPSFEELMHQTEAVLSRHPDCSFIFPHMLFLAGDLDRLSALLDAFPNARLDLSPGVYFYGELHRRRTAAFDFFNSYADRILFGSDGMWFCAGPPDLPQSGLAANSERTARLLRFLSTDDELENPFPYTRAELPVVRGLALPPETLQRVSVTNFADLASNAGSGAGGADIPTDVAVEYLRQFLRRLGSLIGSRADTAAFRSAAQVLDYFISARSE